MTTINKEKTQYILDENRNLTEMYKSDAIPVEHPIGYKPQNAFEVFGRIKGTENYWISNYGRCVNNLNRKDKSTFYLHKQGKVHYTIFEIERYKRTIKKGKRAGEVEIEINRHKRDTSPEELVAEVFLKTYQGRERIWHKDRDNSSNWYKNLIYVTYDDFINLKSGMITWESLHYEQEYIEYVNKANS